MAVRTSYLGKACAAAVLLSPIPAPGQNADSAAVERLRGENFRLRLELRGLKEELAGMKAKPKGITSLDTVPGMQAEEDCFFSLADHWDELTEHVEARTENAGSLAFSVPRDNVYEKYLDVYTIQRRRNMTAILARYDVYRPMIEETFRRYGVPEEVSLLCIVESAASRTAVSRRGAAGLWQLMAETARSYGLRVELITDERFTAEKSTAVAARYLAKLYGMFSDWRFALMAYNCGPGSMQKALERCGADRSYESVAALLPRETREYLPALCAVAEVAYNREKYDF